ncbi:acetate--CoA ligase [Paenarthrobacter aromaticivorans]|uniref:Acetate--CoA ligase n=1 Tax=Paenarthrobacter aromaticivorans TaxID=2849150 RepID=A0ABS6IAA8_9MICC|nr:acetate--CoA ligase [Paenarthrobacter sp. MMS21-TAE1-1]MBU8868529.1 acetate--CoA ligase [Paenarthrobacter sp. MMS21-TAE1-1]
MTSPQAHSTYEHEFARSVEDPEGFWREAAQDIGWVRPPQRILDDTRAPFYRWFADGELNVSWNALDRHVEAGRGSQDAIIFDSAMTGQRRRISYSELLDEVSRFADVLRRHGAARGHRVIIYMPMIPEAVVAMLACARIGAVHSVIFGGFAAPELAARIDDARPNLVITASGGIEPSGPIAYLPILRRALSLASNGKQGTVQAVIVKERAEVPGNAIGLDSVAGEGWLDWNSEIAQSQPAAPVAVSASDPLYVLYTSGTTGRPKGVVRDSGGYAVALAWSMRNVYGIDAGDVWWTASDVGWVVGHSYIVYGPLIVGATTVLYEGKPVGTPDAAAFWRVIERYRVQALFTAPTAIRAIRRTDPELELLGGIDVSSLEAVFLAGEHLDTETYHWLAEALSVPVVDHWWQTETGWPIVGNPRGLGLLEVKPGSATVPIPGFQVEVVDGRASRCEAGTAGNIVVKLPLPPGALISLWSGEERFKEAYLDAFPGYYSTGDGGMIDEDGYVFILGRTDDVINVAGHRLSTGQLEDTVLTHPSIAEAAVIGVRDSLKGERPCAFVTLKAGLETSDDAALRDQVVDLVRNTIGPVASFKDLFVVPRLPKTRSGKVLRKTLREIANGDGLTVPATLDDSDVLQALQAAVTTNTKAVSR